MQPDWDSRDESTNPFAPIDFTSRLQRPLQKRHSSAAAQPPRPGQLYGSPACDPPAEPEPEYWQAPLAPPSTGEQGIPSYLKKQPLESAPAAADEAAPRRRRRSRREPSEAARQPDSFDWASPPPAPQMPDWDASPDWPQMPDEGWQEPFDTPYSAPTNEPSLDAPQEPFAKPQWSTPGQGDPLPGSLYSALPFDAPYSAPVDEPSLDEPQEPFAKPQWSPPDQGDPQPGSLYSALPFDAPYSAPADEPSLDEPVDEIAAFFADDPNAGQSEGHALPDSPADMAQPPLKDAFVPAQKPQPAPLKDAYEPSASPPKAKAKPAKPPIRWQRVAALVLAAGMLVFCAAVGVPTLLELSRNEKDVQTVKADYLEKTGQQLQSSASRVDLPPAGQTFEPTASPTPAAQLQTPTPEPLIPINEAAIADLNRQREGDAVQQAPQATETPPLRTRETAYPDNPMLTVMDSLTALRQEYPEVVGRLVIDGLLDEVVVQRDNMYYLTHNYQGALSAAGAVFMDEYCSLQMPPENLLLRGQSDVDGKTFGPLKRFVTEGTAFAGSYSLATLTTLYEESRYRLFAVLQTSSDPAQADFFSYSSNPTFGSDAEMLNYVQQVKSRSLYNFNVDVDAGDRLLTLSTVGSGDTCVVLVYRRLRPGE